MRDEVVRKELEISGIQDLRSKHKQNWISHLERVDNIRLLKHALNYKPRGGRDRGRPRKRWQRVDAGTGQRPNPWRKKMLMIFSVLIYYVFAV
jgi:predicted ArsR family transcriptional regulator